MVTKIIGTGLTGLVGSRIVELLSSSYQFEDISRTNGTDITDKEAVFSRLQKSDASIVLHCAAYTNVDGAESQKNLGEKSDAWQINVSGTEHVIRAAEETGKKLIYISTDFVFDGEHTPEKGYTEEDMPHPVNWYAKTKYEGELRVQRVKIPWLILRIAYPYRGQFEKKDFFRAMKGRLENNLPIAAVKDHIFCPTFIDDIAVALDTIIQNDITGIYHATGSEPVSPYTASLAIAEALGFDATGISPTTREIYFHEKAQRPFNLTMNNDKISGLGITMRGFREGIEEIKKQSLI